MAKFAFEFIPHNQTHKIREKQEEAQNETQSN